MLAINDISVIEKTLIVPQEQKNIRLDTYLCKNLQELSRSQIQKILKQQNKKPSRLVKPGELIKFAFKTSISQFKDDFPQPQPIQLNIIYEDSDLIVLNKPSGLVVHPGAGNKDGTLVNALLHYLPNLKTTEKNNRPGIVHRLDKETSGLMIVAKNTLSYQNLSYAFQKHEIRKIYRAWCVYYIDKISFELKTGHKRHPSKRKRFTTKFDTDKKAHSKFEVLNLTYLTTLKKKVTELRIEIFSGRTHQIRAQLSDIGHPILGDILYNGPKIQHFNRHALHAEELFFKHPVQNYPMHFYIPPDFHIIQDNCISK